MRPTRERVIGVRYTDSPVVDIIGNRGSDYSLSTPPQQLELHHTRITVRRADAGQMLPLLQM